MKIGTNVLFHGEQYTIRWLYENGNCEIEKQGRLGQVELVSLSEIEIFEKPSNFANLIFLLND